MSSYVNVYLRPDGTTMGGQMEHDSRADAAEIAHHVLLVRPGWKLHLRLRVVKGSAYA